MKNKILEKINKYIPLTKYNKDLIYNIISFGFSAAVILLITFLITVFYKSEGLGYYSQVYAFYMFISQIAAWGVHLSVQKYIPQYITIERHRLDIFWSAIIVTFIFSFLASLIIAYYNNVPGQIVDSAAVSNGFIYVVPGLLFFSLNKVFFAYLNGTRQMKYYAIFSALRFFFMFVTLIVLLVFKMQVIYLSVLFTFPEIILLICFFIYFLKQIKIILSSRTKKLALIHLKYGTKVAWGHIVLGTKPDILIIGYFLSDTIVGIYSFASTIIDGIVQIMYVFRTNINPVITNLYYNYEKKFIENQLKKHIISHYKFFSFIGVFAAIFYPIVLYFLGVNEHLFYYFIVFYILLTGCIIASGFIPLQMIFNQTGYPSTQSIYLLTLFSMNVGLTIVFTFFCGLIGAAVSTSIIFVLQIFLLKWMVRKKLGLTIKII